MARHLFIINPAAGKSDQSALLAEEIRSVFAPRGLEYSIELTKGAGHACEFARAAASLGEETIVYACGGDGTLGEAAQGLAGSKSCALAPVPVGSGNDFVRFFGENAAKKFRSIKELSVGDVRTIDLLRVDGRVCLNIASAGFDAAVCSLMPRYKRLPFVGGPGAYLLSLAHGFFTSVKNRYAFEIDGRFLPPGEYLFAVAANGRFYGGGFCAAPLAELSDGQIDLVLIPSVPRMQMLGMIDCYRRGKHLDTYDFIHFERCRRVRILADEPVLMNLDGEILRLCSPTVSVEPGALRLVIPREPDENS